MSLFNTENDFNDFLEEISQIKIEDHPECPVCLENITDPTKIVKTCCNHVYCQSCYDKINVCALCRRNLNKQHNRHIHQNNNQINQINQNNQINNEININQDFDFDIQNQGMRIYATNYNVLRIMSGMGGIAYSS